MSCPLPDIIKPKEYENILNALDIENFELKTSSTLETRLTLVQLERLKEELIEIRRRISGDMRAITLKYLDSNQKKSSFLGFKTKASSRMKDLANKREKELGPYKKIIDIIDNYIQQIEELEDYLDSLDDY